MYKSNLKKDLVSHVFLRRLTTGPSAKALLRQANLMFQFTDRKQWSQCDEHVCLDV